MWQRRSRYSSGSLASGTIPAKTMDRCCAKAGLLIPKTNWFKLRAAALFHSTPVLEAKRRFPRNGPNTRRLRRLHKKQSLLRNVGAYMDNFFQSSNNGFDEDGPSSSRGTSWFNKGYANKSTKGHTGNRGNKNQGRKGFQFCEDEFFDFETAFRSAFGGNRYFYWSFIREEHPCWSSSYGYRYSKSYNNGRKQRYSDEEDYDAYSDSDCSDLGLASERLALGLSASGPLTVEDVKIAYRSCALKWHPDRHQGSSKVLEQEVAEEKFKLCNAAYQSLCDKLTAA